MALSTIQNNSFADTAVHGFRNILINGAMQVAQRGTSSTSEGYQTVDRFRFASSDMDQLAFTQTQDTTGPSGFTNSYKLSVTTPETTIELEEQLYMFQAIEAQNLQQLGYGTSEAKQLTLSFWVKSSVTGAYCVAFYENDGNRLITSTYSISSANTWEYKTITIDGDTSGTINNDNGAGLELYFFLSVGPDRKTTDSTSWGTWTAAKFGYGQVADVAATSGATWQITGVQLEVGSEPTPFEHRSYGDELARCQRYYYTRGSSSDLIYTYFNVTSGQAYYNTIFHPVEMRAAPALTIENQSLSNFDGINVWKQQVGSFGYYDTATGTGRGGLAFSFKADAEL
jgi:hypothetical protein